MLTHCRGSSPSMEPTGSNPFHLLKITTLVLWCSPPHHITWCPASWLSWGSLQRPGIDFASFISVRVISGDPFMEEWFRKWFFFSDLKKNRKKHEQFSFCVHDMKTENPKMAINYLFDVGFDSFAYSLSSGGGIKNVPGPSSSGIRDLLTARCLVRDIFFSSTLFCTLCCFVFWWKRISDVVFLFIDKKFPK